jgi:hypothetical protein
MLVSSPETIIILRDSEHQLQTPEKFIVILSSVILNMRTRIRKIEAGACSLVARRSRTLALAAADCESSPGCGKARPLREYDPSMLFVKEPPYRKIP